MPRSSLQDAHRRLRVSINSANINYQVIKLHVRLNEQWGYSVSQGCALGLGRLGLETSRDVARSRLGLVSEQITNVSVLVSVSGLNVSVLVV